MPSMIKQSYLRCIHPSFAKVACSSMKLKFGLGTREVAAIIPARDVFAHVLMRHELLLGAGELASVIPAGDTQVGLLDGLLRDQVADPLCKVGVQRHATHGAGFGALGAPLACDVPGRALENLEMGHGVTDDALVHLLHFALADWSECVHVFSRSLVLSLEKD